VAGAPAATVELATSAAAAPNAITLLIERIVDTPLWQEIPTRNHCRFRRLPGAI
jgi:hypothetical protein